MNDKLMKEIILRYKDEVQPPFDEVLKVIGIDALYYIAGEFGGGELYIPTAKRMFGHCLAKQIAKDFTGDNYRELARQYGLCLKSAKDIVERELRGNRRTRC